MIIMKRKMMRFRKSIPLTDPQNFSTTSIDQQIYINIVNDNGCSNVENVNLLVTDLEFEQVNIVTCPENETSPISYEFAETMNQVAESIDETHQTLACILPK